MHVLPEIHSAFNTYLEAQHFDFKPAGLYDPVRYILGLGGKRLRPVVLLLSHQLFDADYQRAFPAAAAVELFHNFTLVHDDIMDEAPLRRGQPTVHQQFDPNRAILSGDVMLVHAYRYLLQLPPSAAALNTSLNVFTQTAIEVCEGQQMDMDFENRINVSTAEYLKMIELKTSVLVGAAMKIGALLGGASAVQAQHLYEFGRTLGIAFQLQDDLLDAYGNPEKFGKQPGGDILQNKKTYLFLKAFELAASPQKQELLHWYSGSGFSEGEKIESVKNLFSALHIPTHTEKLKENYLQEALSHLYKLPSEKVKLQVFRDFAENLMNREM